MSNSAKAHRNGLVTEHEAALASIRNAEKEAGLVFRYLLHHKYLTHWQLESVLQGRAQRASRRTDVLKDRGLVEPFLLDARNPSTGRWAALFKITRFGEEVARLNGIDGLAIPDYLQPSDLRVRPVKPQEMFWELHIHAHR